MNYLRNLLRSFVVLTLVAVTLVFYFPASPASASLAACGADSIGGSIFRDANANGVFDATEAKYFSPSGQYQVEVEAYDQNNVLAGTAVVDLDGDFVIPGLVVGNPYRLEIINLPDFLQPGAAHNGGNFTSLTTFQLPGTCDIEVSVNNPSDFCQIDPTLSTPCYARSMDEWDGTDAFVTVHDSQLGDAGADTHDFALPDPTGDLYPNQLATVADIGATYGVAIDPVQGKIYTSAFHKWATKYGPDGAGAIYELPIDMLTGESNGAIATFHDADHGECDAPRDYPMEAEPHVFFSGLFGPAEYAQQDKTAKCAYGDLEISEDYNTLYTIDLFDQSLKGLPLNADGIAADLFVPDEAVGGGTIKDLCGGIADDTRPYGLAVRDGLVYVTVTCTAESTQNNADLASQIYSYDPTTGLWAEVLSAPVLWDTISTGFFGAGAFVLTNYEAWDPAMENWNAQLYGNDPSRAFITQVQPYISDIEFDEEGYMVLAQGRREADMFIGPLENVHYPLNSLGLGPDSVRVDIFDDLGNLYCAKQSDMTMLFDFEAGDGSCGDRLTPGGDVFGESTPGPVGGPEEFFYTNGRWQDPSATSVGTNHPELLMGGLVYNQQIQSVQFTGMQPTNVLQDASDVFGTGGFASVYFEDLAAGNHASGEGAYPLYWTASDYDGIGTGAFGKLSGLGDVELACIPAPIEIGNRVWFDVNGNGIQDPWVDLNHNGVYDGPQEDEAGINGITVNLYDDAGVIVATAVTDQDGNYVFRGHEWDYLGSDSLSAHLSMDADPTAGDWAGVVPGGLLPHGDYRVVIDDQAGVNGEAANVITTNGANGQQLHLADGSLLRITETDAETAGYYNQTYAADGSGDSVADQADKHDNDGVENTAGAGWEISTYQGSNATDGDTDDADDTSTLGDFGENNHALDFGFVEEYSIGDLVWNDNPASDDGVYVAGDDSPIGNVTLELYRDVDGDGVLTPGTDVLVNTQVTDANGRYTFDSVPVGLSSPYDYSAVDPSGTWSDQVLIPGSYFVHIPASEFAAGGALAGAEEAPSTSGVANPLPEDANEDEDHNANFHAGTDYLGGSTSGVIVIDPATPEPTGDQAVDGNDLRDNALLEDIADENSQLRVDFAFYLPEYDLALIKQLADGTNTGTATVGQDVTFTITVTNQLATDAANVAVVDYIPAGLVLNDAAWVDNGDGTASLVAPIASLPGNSSATVDITFTIGADAAGTLNNFAEISSFTDPDGGPATDVDSTPDADQGDVGPLTGDDPDDDNVDGNSIIGEDEDDHDVASIFVGGGYSIGNQVWFDADDNGMIDAGEPPIPNVWVELFTDNDADGQPDDTNGDGIIDVNDAIATTGTDVDGMYLFDGLPEGKYIVGIPPMEWEAGQPLYGWSPSTPVSGDPNDDVDNDNNGSGCGCDTGYVLSGTIMLGDGEPTGENPDNDPNTPDGDENLTVDFGFYGPMFDLALVKQLADGENVGTAAVGDDLDFFITLINQGNITATNVSIVDYLPTGLVLNDPDWTDNGDGTASIVYPGSLEPGKQVSVAITVTVAEGATGSLHNFAEISEAFDEDGNIAEDIDSMSDTSNDDVGPDAGDSEDDDNVSGNGKAGEDEDDHDVATVTVGSILAKTGASTMGILFAGLVLAAAGAFATFYQTKRRRRIS